MSYAVGGKQLVAVAVGLHAVFTVGVGTSSEQLQEARLEVVE